MLLPAYIENIGIEIKISVGPTTRIIDIIENVFLFSRGLVYV